MASSKERENFVYVAKLAEQAERYEGPIFSTQLPSFSSASLFLFSFFWITLFDVLLCCADLFHNRLEFSLFVRIEERKLEMGF